MTETASERAPHAERNERIARNVLFLASGQVLSTILGLVLTSALGRSLGPSDFGIYYIILTVTTFAAVFVDWGQQTYVVKEVARNRENQAEFIGSAALIRTVIVFASAAASAGLAVVFGYPSIVIWLAPLAVIGSLPATHAILLTHLFRGRDRMELDVTAGLIQKSLTVVATVLALYLGGGVVAAVLMPILGGMAALAFSVSMARRLGISLAMPVKETVREAVWAGSAIVVMSLSIALHPLLDVTLLSILTSPTVVGWLGAARAILGILLAPALILATASFPDLCRVAHSPRDLRGVLSSSSRLLIAAGALGFAVLFSFADAAVGIIYGEGQFDPAALILKVAAPFFPLFFVNLLIGNAALAIGKSVEIAVAKFATVAASAVIAWFLIEIFQAKIGNGAIGVMIAYCATELLMTAAFIYILPQGVLSGSVWTNLLRAYIASIAVCLLAAQIVPVVALWLSAPIVLAAFLGAGFATGLLNVADVGTVASLARSLSKNLRRFKS